MTNNGYRDYFKVLGVDRTSTQNEIKDSFRNLARKYHPDMNPDNAQAEEKFKEINEAYEVLSDPSKRKKYEQFGKYWNQAGGVRSSRDAGTDLDIDFGQYGNFDEFISDLLGRFAGSRSNSSFNNGFSSNNDFSRSVPRKKINLDAQVNLNISFKEAIEGSERLLSVNGERVQVKIPKGVKPMFKLRLKGKGNSQPGTGKRGDLYLNILFEPHSIWKIDGNNLRADLPVSFQELVLGTNVKVLTPDGEVEISIPAGTTPGKSLRLKGKGWPSENSRGDLILTLFIDFPKTWSDEELSLLKKLDQARSNNPRELWAKLARI